MKNILRFLTELSENNDRTWFEANKSWYKEANAEFNEFTENLINKVGLFDPEVTGLTVKDCTWRIYRDVRFSKDKSPYKHHFGAYLSPGGKKSGLAGYYFHVEPFHTSTFGLQGPMLAAGVYSPEPKVLKSLREEAFSNGAGLTKAIGEADGFILDFGNSLKRVPAGYPADSPYANLIKLKDFTIARPITEVELFSDDILDIAVERFRTTMRYNKMLDRAVRYAWEEM